MGGHHVMERNPLTRQRSTWAQVPSDRLAMIKATGAEDLRVFQRNVHDGHLTAIVAREPIGPDGAMQ